MEGKWGIYAGLEEQQQGRVRNTGPECEQRRASAGNNKHKIKHVWHRTVIFNLCGMSLGEIKGPEMRAVGFFLSLIPHLASRHAITRSSASRPEPVSKRAICMLGGFPLGTCADSRLAQRRWRCELLSSSRLASHL